MESLSIFRVVTTGSESSGAWSVCRWSPRTPPGRPTLRLAGAADRLSREYSLTTWSFRAQQLEAACQHARRSSRGQEQGRIRVEGGPGHDHRRGARVRPRWTQPAAAALTDGGVLSRREREVVTMVAAGMTNRQIAQRLFIAERTAEGHVERIRNKLGVRSRTEVATWAVEHGLHPARLTTLHPRVRSDPDPCCCPPALVGGDS